MVREHEPNKLTNILTIVLGELEQVSGKLYELEEEDHGNNIEDASVWIAEVRNYCKEKKL